VVVCGKIFGTERLENFSCLCFDVRSDSYKEKKKRNCQSADFEMFPAAELFRLSAMMSGHGDPGATYSDPGASIVPDTDAEAVEADFKQARQWYKNKMSIMGSGSNATVIFERIESKQKSAGEAIVDKFCTDQRHILPRGGVFVHKSSDDQKCTISLSFFRLLVHSTNAPVMTSTSGFCLLNSGRKYDVAFVTKWEAKLGPLSLPKTQSPPTKTDAKTPPSSSSSSSSSSLNNPPHSPVSVLASSPTSMPSPHSDVSTLISSTSASVSGTTNVVSDSIPFISPAVTAQISSPLQQPDSSPPQIIGSPDHFCSKCAHPAKTRCGRCRCIYYCTRECQATDWTDHKSVCNKTKRLVF
jgi:hypothetical protein